MTRNLGSSCPADGPKTLADMLREDDAAWNDVYEACGQKWQVQWPVPNCPALRRETYPGMKPDYLDCLEVIPADGWSRTPETTRRQAERKRVVPKTPLRVAFETNVCPSVAGGGFLYRSLGDEFNGKRVRVNVETVEGDDE